MSNTNIIGRKITGFEFPDGTDGIGFHKNMVARIGETGEITYVCDRFVTITFDNDGIHWNYPTSLIEQHIVPEEKTIWKVGCRFEIIGGNTLVCDDPKNKTGFTWKGMIRLGTYEILAFDKFGGVDCVIVIKANIPFQYHSSNKAVPITELEKVSPISEHLVPESGGEKDYTPIDFDRLPELQKEIYFDKARGILSGLHCCTRVWEAWQYGTMDQDDFVVADESDELVDQTARRLHDQVEESRAQDFVNAEAYRVENERLKAAMQTILDLCGTVNFSSHNQMREAIEGAVELSESALSQNT